MKLRKFLEEDVGKGDITSEALLGNERISAIIIANEPCVLAGLEEAKKLLELVNVEVRSKFRDGMVVKKGSAVLEFEGLAKDILAAERTALNFLMRMSGVATLTKALIDKCKKINPNLIIAGTRKTTPGFRFYEKKAIQLGGGWAHRYGLYDRILVKGTHLRIVGSVSECIKRAKKLRKEIEIEVENIGQAIEAAKCNADIIMLDNFSPSNARKASEAIRKIDKKIKIEISGGITPKNIFKYATYADIISLGMLTHSVRAIDFSIRII
ncbi:MAG: carboxylating nicotinate-nucleotide diphosphorylase [Candidatus Thermoplasmatota archaeon]|nr:carboxylating nicotinate-nucleotide diphosphorylase [Candidatus Thermoplasmatota archaeon]